MLQGRFGASQLALPHGGRDLSFERLCKTERPQYNKVETRTVSKLRVPAHTKRTTQRPRRFRELTLVEQGGSEVSILEADVARIVDVLCQCECSLVLCLGSGQITGTCCQDPQIAETDGHVGAIAHTLEDSESAMQYILCQGMLCYPEIQITEIDAHDRDLALLILLLKNGEGLVQVVEGFLVLAGGNCQGSE